jgi:hypothetical protein
MTNEEIERIALAHGFEHKKQADGSMALHPHVFTFARALREDQTALIKRILAIVEDHERWTTPHHSAFQRGTIIGMCERAGIRAEEESRRDAIAKLYPRDEEMD